MATRPEEKPSIAPIVGPDDERRFTDSGIEIEHAYHEADVEPNPGGAPGRAGRVPVHARHPPGHVPRPQVDDAPVRGLRHRDGDERALPLPDRARLDRACRWRSTCPTQLGRDSDDPLCAGEVGRTGVAIDTIDDMRAVFDGIPLADVSTSMTINAPAAVLLLLYELVGEEQDVPAEQLRGHDPERRAEGVHRARQLHLPARPGDAA
jgi:methylmalonyl-CoA mutase N-terminal domain/subunit